MTYEQALAYIASLEPRGWRLGLERMRAFCVAAGLEDALGFGQGPKFVHVAGTNGKGSTTAYLQSLMVEGGYRTGAFFSPYVVDPRERVQFCRDLIPPQDLADVTARLIPIAETFTETEFGGITEFEFKTALGFAYWKKKGCEWVALEVGLGGRYDATNVVSPASTILVSVGLDHMNILGDTVAKIAGEKAGIIKPKVPVIVGDLPAEALDVAVSVARDAEAPLYRWGVDLGWEEETRTAHTPFGSFSGLHPGLGGAMQGHNLTLAIAAMLAGGAKLSEEAIRLGAERAFAPGRFQVVRALGTTFLLDGAHNVDAARILRHSLEAQYPGRRISLVTNMVQGHDPADFYRTLVPLVEDVHVVPIDFHRAFPVETTISSLRTLGLPAQGHDELWDGLAAAASVGEEGLVLVTGSFYLVGAVLRRLDGEPA